jgi:hypothetical protein
MHGNLSISYLKMETDPH